jgi:hypothetical protein
LQAGQLADFEVATGGAEAAKKQIEAWVRAYMIARGETDRLLAQSPLATELLTYLESTDAPGHLRDQVKYLIMQRESDGVKIVNGINKTESGTYLV